MFRVTQSTEVIEIQSYMPTGQRFLLLILAGFPVLAPYELIIRPNWYNHWNLVFLFAALISMGALAVSAFMVWGAIAGLNSRLRFDRANGSLTYSAGAPVVPWRNQRYPIAGIARLGVEEHDWSEGAPSYSFLTQMADGRKFKSGSSWSKEEIEEAVERVVRFLGFSNGV